MPVAEYICDVICRGFTHLSSIARKRLVDGLCSNLSVLGLSIGALVSVQEPDDAAEHEAAATSHRSALTAFVFLLAWLSRLAEDEAKAAASTSDAKAGEKCQLVANFEAHDQSLLPCSIAKSCRGAQVCSWCPLKNTLRNNAIQQTCGRRRVVCPGQAEGGGSNGFPYKKQGISHALRSKCQQ